MTTKHEIKRSINMIIREKGRFPSPQEMCNALGYSEQQMKNYMQALEEDGYLEKIGDWYKFPEKPFEVQETVEVKPPDFVEVKPKTKRGRPKGTVKESRIVDQPKPKKPAYVVQIGIIQIIMTAIGIGASIISIYYTSIWLIEFLPLILAILLSSIMTAFAVSAFETTILFLSGEITDNKYIKAGAVLGFAVLWVVVTFFSIISTVAGQVNEDFKKKAVVESKIDYNEKQRWSILQDEKKDLQARLSDYQEQQKTFRTLLSEFNTVEKREQNRNAWWDINNKLRVNQNNIDKALKELDNIRQSEREILSKTKSQGPITEGNVEQTDFYKWLSKILGVDADRIQFVLVLLPAVFVDLIAPVGIAVTLFLRSKNSF